MSQMVIGGSRWLGDTQTPGELTMSRAMRAVTVAGATPRVLRIAVVENGNIVRERIFRERMNVTAGDGEQSMFEAAFAHCVLFELSSGTYYLNVVAGMRARLVLDGAVTEIEAPSSAQIAQRVKLSADSRGKIVLGGATLVFQFVDAPFAAKPMLPASVKRGLFIDWNMTVISAISFVAHFGIVAAISGQWQEPMVRDEGRTVHAFVETESRLLPASEVVHQSASSEDDAPTRTERVTEAPSSAPTGKTPTWTGTPQPSREESIEARMRAKLRLLEDPNAEAHLRVAVVDPMRPETTRVSPGFPDPGAASTLEHSNTPWTLPTSTTLTVPPRVPADPTRRELTLDPTVPSRPVVDPGAPSVEAVVRSRLSPAARYCYQKGLQTNPNQSGRVVLNLQVNENGDVTSVAVGESAGLDASTVACIAGSAHVHFGKIARAAVVSVPFAFVKQ